MRSGDIRVIGVWRVTRSLQGQRSLGSVRGHKVIWVMRNQGSVRGQGSSSDHRVIWVKGSLWGQQSLGSEVGPGVTEGSLGVTTGVTG